MYCQKESTDHGNDILSIGFVSADSVCWILTAKVIIIVARIGVMWMIDDPGHRGIANRLLGTSTCSQLAVPAVDSVQMCCSGSKNADIRTATRFESAWLGGAGLVLGSVQMCCSGSKNADIRTATRFESAWLGGAGLVLGSVQMCCSGSKNVYI